jgi:predicted nucleic acid-binding protein
LRKRPARRAGRTAEDRRVFVDSSAWLAYFSARDDNHTTAAALFQRAIGRRVSLVTTILVVAEVHRLVLHRVGIKAAAAVLEAIDGSTHVRLVFPAAAHHEAARGWLEKLSDQEITYADATSFAVMRAEHCPSAITFDRDFVIAGFDVWRT